MARGLLVSGVAQCAQQAPMPGAAGVTKRTRKQGRQRRLYCHNYRHSFIFDQAGGIKAFLRSQRGMRMATQVSRQRASPGIVAPTSLVLPCIIKTY